MSSTARAFQRFDLVKPKAGEVLPIHRGPGAPRDEDRRFAVLSVTEEGSVVVACEWEPSQEYTFAPGQLELFAMAPEPVYVTVADAVCTHVPKPVYSSETFRVMCREIIDRGAKTFYKEWWEDQARRYQEWRVLWDTEQHLVSEDDVETRTLVRQVEALRQESRGVYMDYDSDSD